MGNSCNYIVSTRNEDDLQKLYFILNSSLLNWRFKITSSNNHINNYELDELPIVDLDNFDNKDLASDKSEIDNYICQLYGLNNIESEYITGNKILKKLKPLYEQEII